MVMNDIKIYFAEGDVNSAVFTVENQLENVASYSIPSEQKDVVERTYFNTDHVKKYGVGYSTMSETTMKVDLDEVSIVALKELKELYKANKIVTFGIVPDEEIEDLKIKYAAVIKQCDLLDGEVTPGTNAQGIIVVQPISRLSAFKEPTE